MSQRLSKLLVRVAIQGIIELEFSTMLFKEGMHSQGKWLNTAVDRKEVDVDLAVLVEEVVGWAKCT